MTIFEYIKEKMTKEEFAYMMTFLENDSGYYNRSNAETLLLLGKLEKIPKLFNNPEDKQMYQTVLDILERECKQ